MQFSYVAILSLFAAVAMTSPIAAPNAEAVANPEANPFKKFRGYTGGGSSGSSSSNNGNNNNNNNNSNNNNNNNNNGGANCAGSCPCVC